MTVSQPTLTVIAGPNGAGKSTFTRATQEALRVPIIDPDSESLATTPQ
jgi:predicted ABC-type ATPase